LVARNTRRVDVIDARPNLVGVPVVLEGVEKLHVALGCLDRNDISIETLNRWEDIVEVGVTEVRMGLEGVSDARCGQLKGVNSPFEVRIPVSTAKGQLAKCKM
jgi:hypothetical protein